MLRYVPIVLIAVWFWPVVVFAQKEFAQKVTVNAKEIALNEEKPGERRVGKLTFVKGWALTGDHDQFAGLSALRMLPSGEGGLKLLSITDGGLWLRADFDMTSPTPITNATLTWQRPLPEYAKKKQDTESIIVLEDGYLFGAEQIHRIMKVTEIGTPAVRSPLTDEIDFRSVGSNGGLEAMTRLDDGRILAFLEGGRDRKGRHPAYILGGAATERLYFKPSRNFKPTDATTLKNGDILVLTRFYSFIDGVAAELHHIPKTDLRAGAVLAGERLATLRPPLSVDNMEGLDVVETSDGRTLVFMVSDDNANALQRTLLMVFELTL